MATRRVNEGSKTLKAFWHWIDNEQPQRVEQRHLRNLSPVALQAYVSACAIVDNQIPLPSDIDRATARRIVRDASVALCAMYEHMHEQVEAAGDV